MFCAISGVVPDEPVVSRAGFVYERRLAAKHIESTGKEPSTGEPAAVSDLLTLQSPAAARARPVAASSVHGLLSHLQSEWDALMLETHSLRQALEGTRQELSQALYQHDAACRVTARLIRERDNARAALAAAQSSLAARGGTGGAGAAADAGGDVDMMGGEEGGAGGAGMTQALVSAMSDKHKELTKGRKKRAIPPGTATRADLHASPFALLSTHSPHAAAHAGICAIAAAPTSSTGVSSRANLVLTGGADKAALVFDIAAGRVAARLLPLHAKRVTDVAWHPTPEASDVLFTACGDGSVKTWAPVGASAAAGGAVAEYAPAVSFRPHGGREVSSLAIHPLGSHAASCGRDGAWAFSDLSAGRVLASVPVHAEEGVGAPLELEGIRFHPDGVLLGLAASDGRVHIFDVRDTKRAAAVGTPGGGSFNALAFSENGFHIASASASGAVALWDLRKVSASPEPVHSWSAAASAGVAATAVAFDYSGAFLAGGGGDGSVSVWETKDPFSLCGGATLRHHVGPVSGLAWGAGARTLTSVGGTDRAMHMMGLGGKAPA